MAKISGCLSFLLVGGNKKRSKVQSKGAYAYAYARKGTGNDCPKVKPVEFMDMADAVEVSKVGGHDAPAPATNVFVRTAAESPRQEDKRDVSDAGLVASSGYGSNNAAAVSGVEPEPKDKEVAVEEEHPILPNQNQWVSDRVSAWVDSLGTASFHAVVDGGVAEHDDDDNGAAVAHASCSEIVQCSTADEKQTRARRRAAGEAVLQAGSIVQTLNAASSVAHVSGMGLQAVPVIAAFTSLRAVNLSGNFIVHIHQGSLPKGLHSLDLSKNKIASIEGLRELTRLRVLNLSYNRISRIGRGLSSCTAIRELYLAGNKISDVEGLHRLLKLAVLDVSFNKVTTAKSLGQLVANYGSLRALNLLGNPVQANVGDDTLRRAVTGLLPRLEYLNKQAVKPRCAREVAKDSVAQAALGNGGARSRRTTARRVRVSQSPGSSSRRGSRSRSKTRAQHSSSLSSVKEVS